MVFVAGANFISSLNSDWEKPSRHWIANPVSQLGSLDLQSKFWTGEFLVVHFLEFVTCVQADCGNPLDSNHCAAAS